MSVQKLKSLDPVRQRAAAAILGALLADAAGNNLKIVWGGGGGEGFCPLIIVSTP